MQFVVVIIFIDVIVVIVLVLVLHIIICLIIIVELTFDFCLSLDKGIQKIAQTDKMTHRMADNATYRLNQP